MPALFGPSAHDPPKTEPASEILRFIRGTSGTVPINTMGPWSDVRDVARAHVAALMRGGASEKAGGDRFFAVAGMYNSKQICKVVEKWFPQLIAEGRTPRSGSVPGAFEEEMWEDGMLGSRYEGDNRVAGELGVSMRCLEESVVDTVESLLKFEEVVKGHGKGVALEAGVTPTGGPGPSSHLSSCTCGECATRTRHRRTSVDELDESTLEEGVDKDNLYTLVEQAYEGSVSGMEPATSNIPRSLAGGEAICVCAPGDQCTCAERGIVEEQPMRTRRISVVLNKPDTGEMLRHS